MTNTSFTIKEVLEAFIDVTDGNSCDDIRESTGLPEVRCKKIVLLNSVVNNYLAINLNKFNAVLDTQVKL